MYETVKKRKLTLTELEFDLIETVRNYKRSYPNGEPEIRYYIEKTFMEYLDEPLEDSENTVLPLKGGGA